MEEISEQRKAELRALSFGIKTKMGDTKPLYPKKAWRTYWNGGKREKPQRGKDSNPRYQL